MIKSKRGRKPKVKLDISNQVISDTNLEIKNSITKNIVGDISNNIILPKKRGRKPKGGKIIENLQKTSKVNDNIPNIILHLNSTISDVDNLFNNKFTYNPKIADINSYTDIDNKLYMSNYELINNKDNHEKVKNKNIESNNHEIDSYIFSNSELPNSELLNSKSQNSELLNSKSQNSELINSELNKNSTNNCFFSNIAISKNDINCIGNQQLNNNKNENKKSFKKSINIKLLELAYKLNNNIPDGKSACFWCTYCFDSPNIYIPSSMTDLNINVYGCFCSPECATAHLINENLDASTKYERYYLLNHLYSKIYNYNKLIKPAPNPYYVLEKYCGNLTIEEYRNLLNDDNLIIIDNKPLTRIYPELFEDNNNSNISNIINNNSYSINKYN